jgi:ferritin-like metal-binding protein YciE
LGTDTDEEDTMTNLNSLNDVFEEQLQDLYSAEQQLTQALPKMAQAASTDELRQAFQNHLQETQGHVQRLQELLPTLGFQTGGETCEAMQGLIKEGDKVVQATGDPIAKDAALIAAAQRVEHYEIAGYGTAASLAGELGFDDAKDVLEQTLDEEANADKLLTKIATGGMFKSGVNAQAAR